MHAAIRISKGASPYKASCRTRHVYFHKAMPTLWPRPPPAPLAGAAHARLLSQPLHHHLLSAPHRRCGLRLPPLPRHVAGGCCVESWVLCGRGGCRVKAHFYCLAEASTYALCSMGCLLAHCPCPCPGGLVGQACDKQVRCACWPPPRHGAVVPRYSAPCTTTHVPFAAGVRSGCRGAGPLQAGGGAPVPPR